MSEIARQSYPASRMKVGAVLYEAFGSVVDGSVQTGLNEWVVRSIRVRRNTMSTYGNAFKRMGLEVPKAVNLIQRNKFTWGKVSAKAGDYGWLPNIWSGFRQQFTVGRDLPPGLFTTERAAYSYLRKSLKDELKWYERELRRETDLDEIAVLTAERDDLERVLKAVERRLSKPASK